MDWLGWILSSCVVLSLYDLSKKASVRGNAVFPTLLGSTAAGWLAVTAFLVWRGAFAAALGAPPAPLPITFAAPIRATGPLWTLLGAIVLFSEVPTAVQAAGMAMIVVGCVLFSRSAAKEGIDFWRSRAVLYAFLGTVLGSCSALYDKHLLKNLAIPTGTVLWWFMGGMCVIYAVAVASTRAARSPRPGETQVRFQWRWTIPLVGVLLALSDACYFNAVSVPGARISVLSMIRRSSVVLTFLLGGAVFHEANLRRKAVALAAILAGVAILCLAKQ